MSKRMVAIIAVFVLAIAAVIFQIQTPKVLGKATTEIFKGVMAGAQQTLMSCSHLQLLLRLVQRRTHSLDF